MIQNFLLKVFEKLKMLRLFEMIYNFTVNLIFICYFIPVYDL